MTVNIVFLTDAGSAPAGSEELWSQSAARLASSGYRVSAFVSRWRTPHRLYDPIVKAGGELVQKPVPSIIGRVARRLRLVPEHRDLFSRNRPNLVVYCSPGHPINTTMTSYCLKKKIPYVIIVQAASDTVWPEGEIADEVYRGYEGAKACYFVSEGNRRLVQRQLGIALENARIVSNPYLVPFNSAPPWPLPGEEWRLACVARLHGGHKGQDLILDVLSRSHWRDRPLRVVFYGEGPHGPLFVRRASQLGLCRVDFAGHTSDVRQIWVENHGLILSSRSEGLPLALVESALCDRMAVVTDVAGNAEIVRDEVTGFVAKAPTVDLLDEALERAWIRRMEWQEIGKNAGTNARQIVPSDPVGKFVEELERVAEEALR